MLRLFLLNTFVLIFSTHSLTQTAINYLNQNNINTLIGTGGVFFNDAATSSPAYEYPAQSSNHLIYATSFWFGGKDINGNVKLSGQKYTLGQDIFPGPLTTDGSAQISPSVVSQYDKIWVVSKADIDDHIANYSSSGYTVPSSIQDWPAHGDVSLNQDYYLAPFVDHNNNGLYDPANGDYPLIRGDRAAYMILNDKADVHSESGADAIGIECHFMFYQYNSSDDLNNTTFVNIKLINRGTQTLYDFAVGSFLDADIGNATDDYMGCDSTLNLMYAYNGQASDSDYGSNPPAVGIVSLNHNMATAGLMTISGPTALPATPAEYHLYLTGYWKDGSPRTLGGSGYGGTTPNKYQYHGNPNNAGEWSEANEANPSGDRKMIGATETITLNPEDEICYDYAIVVGDGGNNIENVNNLISATTFVQDFYNNQNFICENYEATLNSGNRDVELQPTIYPTPTKGLLNIELTGSYQLEIFSIDGRLVKQQTKLNNKEQISLNLESGTYLLKITQNGEVYTQKIMVK